MGQREIKGELSWKMNPTSQSSKKCYAGPQGRKKLSTVLSSSESCEQNNDIPGYAYLWHSDKIFLVHNLTTLISVNM